VQEVNTMAYSDNKKNDNFGVFTSVKKEFIVAGKKQYIWHERVMLVNGQLMPLEEFMVKSGQRVYLRPISIERNSREEIKAAKKAYADDMYRKYGWNWRNEKKGAVITLHSLKSLNMLTR